jgi:hypothetical protein
MHAPLSRIGADRETAPAATHRRGNIGAIAGLANAV